jgi:hypothetical protein
MAKPARIEFIPLSMSDGSKLIVLKSKYNRYAARFNLIIMNGWSQEQQDLLFQLKDLKERIDQQE